MIPHILIQERLVLERLRQWQRGADQNRMLAGLPRHRRHRPLLGCLGTCLVSLGMRARRSALGAGLLLGVLWGLWHAPVVDYLGAAAPHGLS